MSGTLIVPMSESDNQGCSGVAVLKISIIGTGYVGAVTGACLAELGHDIVFVGRDTKKLDLIQSGKSPIYEPGLDQLLEKNLIRITTTVDLMDAIRKTALTFICVGTPSNDDGSIDLDQIQDVSHTIGKSLASADVYHTIIVKSTVLPGTSAVSYTHLTLPTNREV